jgi:uncharacterized protein YyaL (SSP411 family)
MTQSQPAPPGRNRLRFEKSPYLLQHKDNPVDWYPWGEEAFQAARQQDKPVFLSIGYSTCHWCHVMAHESFEDQQVAAAMNEAFVNIKVDREERPDLDAVYMAACHMLTRGSGGWPLTIILTPDGKPFFAATYIPKDSGFGRTGMLELIPRIRDVWQHRRGDVARSADQIVAALQEASKQAASGDDLGLDVLAQAAEQLSQHYDPVYGGFGKAPKFPSPHNLLFLLRHWKRSGSDQTLSMVEKTLQAIRRGGIYDQVGFGMHRYSVDQEWRVPHFEKMLYDQALLVMACIETYQATRKRMYANIAREVLTYVLRDMRDEAGGFYSAEDADSEGEEGRFYLWTEDEIRKTLSAEQADLLIETLNVRADGNYVDPAGGGSAGRNILFLSDPMAPQNQVVVTIRDERTLELFERARQALFEARTRRVHPGKDDKVLTDWNGLMIAALAKAAAVLDEPDYAEAARKAAGFLLRHVRTPRGRLLHRWRDGQAGIAANLDDYAFLVWGLIELYEATFEAQHLRTALKLTDDMIRHFWDAEAGGLFFTPDDGEPMLVRQKLIYDGAVPSGNSVAMYNLLRLARMTGRTRYEKRATEISRMAAPHVHQAPVAYTQLLVALDWALGPSHEVVIAGPPHDAGTKEMLSVLSQRFIPNKVVLLRPTDEPSPAITRIAPFTADQTGVEDRPTAYVCEHFRCHKPTTDPQQMLALLSS